MERPVLTLEGLSKFYTSTRNVVVGLNDIKASFHRGEFVAITGESGSGKSTLAQVIGGIFPYESGEMYFCGQPTSHFDGRDWERYRRDNISFISQSYGILLSATVMENVVSALRLTGMEKADAVIEAEDILKKVQLWDLRRRRAAKLSSGQKQRLSIARALAKPAPILIADEPTGNLDPENSAVIIELLAQAAKDRLVILITHDFYEAQDYATRRIALQDGRITMDAQLRPANVPEKPLKKRPENKKPLSMYVSRLQLGGRPVWCSLVLLFFALTAFAVFAFLGTFIVALDDTGTKAYDNSAFRNGDPLRVVVSNLDGSPLTQADYDALLSVDHVSALEKHSLFKDINVFYKENEHYKVSYFVVNEGSPTAPNYVTKSSIRFESFEHFAATVPLMAPGETFLTSGRLPENISEVVVFGDKSQIGTTFRLYLSDYKTWATGYYIFFDVTVVGVTDLAEGVYCHDDLGRIFTHNNDGPRYQFLYLPDPELADDRCRIPSQIYRPRNAVIDLDQKTGKGNIILREEETITLAVEGIHDMTYISALSVSPAVFEKLTPKDAGGQVSLFLENYAYTKRVLESVREMGYMAASPYQIGATTPISDLVQQRNQTLIICIAALIAVVALQIIVLRALFGSEIENYRLLSNIGLSCATAMRSVLWQVLLFTVAGQAAGFAALWQCNRMGIERIVSIIRYLPPELMALLSAVHLAAALVAAFWIARALRKRVYPLVSNPVDLQIDEEEEVAE